MNAKELAEIIAHYARVRLCVDVDFRCRSDDYILSEQDRVLIVRALREMARPVKITRVT